MGFEKKYEKMIAQREGRALAAGAVEARANAEQEAAEVARMKAEISSLTEALNEYELERLPPDVKTAVEAAAPKQRRALATAMLKHGAYAAPSATTTTPTPPPAPARDAYDEFVEMQKANPAAAAYTLANAATAKRITDALIARRTPATSTPAAPTENPYRTEWKRLTEAGDHRHAAEYMQRHLRLIFPR